jgi:tetratricopeptide (TPR) repeat protein
MIVMVRMMVSRASIVLLLALALTTAAPAVFPAPPQSRSEALRALEDADAKARAEAIVWIANLGTMADAPLLEARLRDESAFVRSFAEQGLWLLWSRSGDAQLDQLMARGVEAMQAGRHAEAIGLFSQVIERNPGFAEGWNKRATVYFLAGEYDKSIADCDEVLKRNPHHFGALSGLGEVYLALDRPAQALVWFKRALEVNPNLLGVEFRIKQIEGRIGGTST